MALNTTAVMEAVSSHALASGYFDRVSLHEPKSAPGNGLTAAVWAQRLRPIRSSGLASVSALLVLNLRIFSSALQEPQDEIDPNIVGAVDALMTAYCGDFELGGLVRHVDIFGSAGVELGADAGYVRMDDGRLMRVMTLTVPLLINDLYAEAP